MATVTLADILDAIEDTLDASAEVKRSQSYDQLTESISDLPLLQVYPEDGIQDALNTADRTTFGGCIRHTRYTVNVDYYARQRSHIGEDMAQLVDGIDSLTDIFEAQNSKPYFGLDGIQAFHWSWRRVTIDYAGVSYVGARFALEVRVY